MIPEGCADTNMSNEGPVSLEPEIDNAHTFLNELFNPIRDLTKNFDVDLSQILTKYAEEILRHSQNGNTEEFHSVNFTEAALVIQGSASIYGKKVEFLYNLATKLLQFLHDEKKKASGNSKNSKDKDVLVAGRHNNDEFVANDEIKYQPDTNRLNEDFKTAHRRYVQTFLSRTPLALVTLSESEKGDTSLMTKSGEVFGNRNDYNMNTCQRDEFDFLSLPTLNCAGLYESTSDNLANISVSSSHIGNSSGAASDDSIRMDFQPLDENPMDTNSDAAKGSSENIPEVPPNGVETNVVPGNPPNNDVDMEDDYRDVHEDPVFDDGPVDLPPENAPISDPKENIDDPCNGSRRRSLRQAKKQEKAAAAAAAEENFKKQWCREENQKKDVVLPIQKNEKKSKRGRKKKCTGRDSRCSTEIINEVLHGGRKGLDHQKVCLDSKTLKKMPLAKDITVNEAFELLFTNNYQDEKEVADQLRKQLELNNKAALDVDFGFADASPEQDDDDNDSGPDIGGDIPMPNQDECFSPDSGLFASPDQQLSSSSEAELSFEGALRTHVENYMKEADKYTENTELSERVKAWEEKIKPILELESERESFDIHLYGSRIIDNFADNNRKQSIPFAQVVKGKSDWEICRYFLATLVLANNNNVEISSNALSNGMDDVNLTLLSRKRHQEKLDAFGHSFGEHN